MNLALSPLPTLPAILDIEASGFGRGSYPVEIGFVMPDGRPWCTLILPEADWTHWDAAAEAIHGITRPLLEKHGKPVAEVARQLNEHLRGLTVYCDGWAHDYSWLGLLFDCAENSPAFRLQSIRELLSDAEADRWHEVKTEVIRALDLKRHRASGDARVIQETLRRIKGLAAHPAAT